MTYPVAKHILTPEEAQEAPPPPLQEGEELPPIAFDEDTRLELLEEIKPFIIQMKMEKRAKLHRRIGRARKFYGGGI